MPFQFTRMAIPDVVLIEPKVFSDDRGYFLETYKESEFREIGITEKFSQDNHSFSRKNVLRGLHFQLPPAAQGKIIMAITGAIWDVAVDIRKDSPTFRRWVAHELSGENRKMLYLPPGFAHGFTVLSDETHIVYKCTSEYAPDLDRGIVWNDPSIAVAWPVADPIVSGKDRQLPLLDNAGL